MKTITNIIPIIFLSTIISLITYNVVMYGVVAYISFNGM